MIYLECYADEILVKTLGISRKEINHIFGKGNICNRLEKERNSRGLVDEDPFSNSPKYIDKLKTVSVENDVKLLYDEKSQNYLIVLCPRLEEWILRITKEVNLDMKEYGLSDDINKFRKIIKIKPKILESLIEDIKQKSKSLKTLEKFIKK